MMHPVTEGELNQIKNDCKYPENSNCGGCDEHSMKLGCVFKGANAIMDEVLSRPDPLDILEAQIEYHYGNSITISMKAFSEFIHEIRTNPNSVEKRGEEEGWWPTK